MSTRSVWTVAVLLPTCAAAFACGRSASIARPAEVAPAPLPVPPLSQLAARLEVPIQTLRSAALERAKISALPKTLADTTLTFALSPRNAGRAAELFIRLPLEVAVKPPDPPPGFILKQFNRLDPLRLACANLRSFVETIPVVDGVAKTACYVRRPPMMTRSAVALVSYVKQATQTVVDGLPSTSVGEASLSANARLESVDVKMEGDLVTATASASIAARVGGTLPFAKAGIVSCGFGETRPEARVTIAARVALDPAGNLAIRERVPRLDWIRSCNISAAEIDFVRLLDVLGVHRHVEDALDGLLAKVTTRVILQDRYASIWDTLQVPHGAGMGAVLRDSLWFLLNPERIQLQSIEGRNDTIVSGVALRARPRLVLGPRPPADTGRFPGVTVGSAPGDFRLRIAVEVARDAAVRQLTSAMRSASFSTPAGTVRVDSVDIYPAGNTTVLALNVRSPFKGWIFLTGTLAVTSNTGAAETVLQASATPIGVDSTAEYRILFQDLQFTLATQNALLNVADWVAHDLVRKLIQQRAQIPLSPLLARALARLPSTPVPLGRVAEGRLGIVGVRPVGVHIDSGVITALLDAVGSATVRLLDVP